MQKRIIRLLAWLCTVAFLVGCEAMPEKNQIEVLEGIPIELKEKSEEQSAGLNTQKKMSDSMLEPTVSPVLEPTTAPTAVLTATPTAEPTTPPTPESTAQSTPEPTTPPTPESTAQSTAEPTTPTPEPTAQSTAEPTTPTPEPTAQSTPEPTEEPKPEPTEEPKPEPTEEPKPEPTAEPTPEPTAEPTPQPTVAPAQSTEELPPLQGETPQTGGHIIAIDAGHQAKANREKEPVGPGSEEMKAKVSSGTRGVATGVYEYELNLTIAQALKTELEARGYTIVMIRESHDVDISNKERAETANSSGAEIFLRIHANGSEKSSVQGTLTICNTASSPYNPQIHDQSLQLSQEVLSHMVALMGSKDRGIWETDTMSGINWCTIPVTIIEMGYMSNEDEDRLMQEPDYQKRIVLGIADGVDAYFSQADSD